jgi:uncharacterized protein
VAELAIRLQPRARRDEVVGERGGAVVIRVTASPVDGRANRALCRLVAKAAGVAPSKVAIVRGLGSRDRSCASTASKSTRSAPRSACDRRHTLPQV